MAGLFGRCSLALLRLLPSLCNNRGARVVVPARCLLATSALRWKTARSVEGFVERLEEAVAVERIRELGPDENDGVVVAQVGGPVDLGDFPTGGGAFGDLHLGGEVVEGVGWAGGIGLVELLDEDPAETVVDPEDAGEIRGRDRLLRIIVGFGRGCS